MGNVDNRARAFYSHKISYTLGQDALAFQENPLKIRENHFATKISRTLFQKEGNATRIGALGPSQKVLVRE